MGVCAAEKRTVEIAVTQFIRSMGIQVNLKGYKYLRTAVLYTIQQQEMLDCRTMELYGKVAEIYRVKYHSVERAIRNAIDLAYCRSPESLQKHFDYPVGKPSNSEVIALIVDNIRIWTL